ncbi:MAG: hypothetical protein M3R51_06265 [Candidatus Eremiobacteraeota bacterium]|nr:hypothetical protein [Candidatus Eremiobacteraeota bacterium]
MFDVTQAKERRRFYPPERGMRKKPIGAGSNLTFLMSLPRSPVMLNIDDVFGDIPVLVAGGVAARAYLPERQTKDIDFMVEDRRFAEAMSMLGRLSDEKLQKITDVVERYSVDGNAADEIRQYAQLGRWELTTQDGNFDKGEP